MFLQFLQCLMRYFKVDNFSWSHCICVYYYYIVTIVFILMNIVFLNRRPLTLVVEYVRTRQTSRAHALPCWKFEKRIDIRVLCLDTRSVSKKPRQNFFFQSKRLPNIFENQNFFTAFKYNKCISMGSKQQNTKNSRNFRNKTRNSLKIN